jgi:uncharacterized protein (TIGR02246 family)
MSTDERAIRDVIAQWHRATAAGDVDAILRLMADDVVFLVPGKPPLHGRSAFESGLRKLLQSHRVESTGDVQEVQVSGDLAFSWTRLTVSMTPLAGGTPNVRTGSALSIFRKKSDGAWVLARDANLLPPL